MESMSLHSIGSTNSFNKSGCPEGGIKIALQQDQLLTKEGASRMANISNAVFLKTINDGICQTSIG